jgi:hypothetical protein
MKILMTVFLLFNVLFLIVDSKIKSKKAKDIRLTEESKKFFDKNLNPKNPRTKLTMIKNFVHGVLDQLELPDNKIDEKISEAGSKNLMACMTLFKNIAHGNSKVDKLESLKDYLNYKEIAEKVKNKKSLENAEEYIKKFVKKIEKKF